MRFSRFLAADMLAALISAPLMVGIGYIAAEHYETLFSALKEIKLILLCLAPLLAYVIVRRFRKKKGERSTCRSA